MKEETNYCDSCRFLTFLPDPDPYDWFRDGDQKAVCEKTNETIQGALERPSEMVQIRKPSWCPKQEDNYCDSCRFLIFEPDPDPYDWFRDGDKKAVCEKTNETIQGALERPSEMVQIRKPSWCPRSAR